MKTMHLFALLKKLKCKTSCVDLASAIVVIFYIFQEERTECFVLAGNQFSVHGYTVFQKYCDNR